MRFGFRLVFLLLLTCRASAAIAQTPYTHPELTKKLKGEDLFWKGEPIKLPKLKAAKIKLIGKPNLEIDYAVVEIGERDPTNFLDKTTVPAFVPLVDNTSEPYAVAKEPLNVGGKVYGDRTYLLKELPDQLKGLTLLQTRAAHKAIVDARYAIVVQTEKPVWVFVALDDRGLLTYESLGVPGWLKEFSPTGLKIHTDDTRMQASNSGYQIVARRAGPGKVVLGAPAVEVGYNSMYFAFFGEEQEK